MLNISAAHDRESNSRPFDHKSDALSLNSITSGANVGYLCDELRRPADTEARRRLRSASSTSLDVRRTRLSTVGDKAFPVAAARLCNSLPSLTRHCCPISPSSIYTVVLNHISSHFLFPLSVSSFICTVPARRAVTRHFEHYNRYYI